LILSNTLQYKSHRFDVITLNFTISSYTWRWDWSM